ncbi:putative Rad60/SUMO-like domain-containing protein [Medicago truncatula]|uniref:Putative Rad60/SUMO-like domain-containing protein n=1 Tax=Medicago truncatula TaxID=3880 RepID=A0A396IPD8_MEDTR|nr:putative Rad60/SUMO-like domain-containing protein [Medicago truncatula]
MDGDIIHTMCDFGRDIVLNVKGQRKGVPVLFLFDWFWDGFDGYEASFTMDECSRLEKLMDFYCRRYCLDITEVVFLFNGRLIRADQTPAEVCV